MKSAPRSFEFHLDSHTGVPVYRQLIDQVRGAVASGRLKVGDQLPTIRRVAVDLAINPNTVSRSYRDLELLGTLETQQGTGTFIAEQVRAGATHRERQLSRLALEVAARAGADGFTVAQLVAELEDLHQGNRKKRG